MYCVGRILVLLIGNIRVLSFKTVRHVLHRYDDERDGTLT